MSTRSLFCIRGNPMHPMHPNQREKGFTLIELLVVLVIVGILSSLGIYFMPPKTPRAVQIGLTELRGAFIQARSLAASSGRTVVVNANWPTGALVFQQVADDFTLMNPALSSVALDPSWRRFARILAVASVDALTPGQSSRPDGVPAIKSFVGTWPNPVSLTSGAYGFTPTGVPVFLDTAAPGTAPAPLVNGTWIGVVGNTGDINGLPYGVVVVNGRGNTTAYYKAHSKIDTPAENLWKRLD